MRFARQALKDIAQIAKLDTTLAGYRRLIAQKLTNPAALVIPDTFEPRVTTGSCPT